MTGPPFLFPQRRLRRPPMPQCRNQDGSLFYRHRAQVLTCPTIEVGQKASCLPFRPSFRPCNVHSFRRIITKSGKCLRYRCLGLVSRAWFPSFAPSAFLPFLLITPLIHRHLLVPVVITVCPALYPLIMSRQRQSSPDQSVTAGTVAKTSGSLAR